MMKYSSDSIKSVAFVWMSIEWRDNFQLIIVNWSSEEKIPFGLTNNNIFFRKLFINSISMFFSSKSFSMINPFSSLTFRWESSSICWERIRVFWYVYWGELERSIIDWSELEKNLLFLDKCRQIQLINRFAFLRRYSFRVSIFFIGQLINNEKISIDIFYSILVKSTKLFFSLLKENSFIENVKWSIKSNEKTIWSCQKWMNVIKTFMKRFFFFDVIISIEQMKILQKNCQSLLFKSFFFFFWESRTISMIK